MNDENTYSAWSIAAIVISFMFAIPALILSAIAIKENYNERSNQLARGARIVSIVRIIIALIMLLLWALLLSLGASMSNVKSNIARQFDDAYEIMDTYTPLVNSPDSDIGGILENKEE